MTVKITANPASTTVPRLMGGAADGLRRTVVRHTAGLFRWIPQRFRALGCVTDVTRKSAPPYSHTAGTICIIIIIFIKVVSHSVTNIRTATRLAVQGVTDSVTDDASQRHAPSPRHPRAVLPTILQEAA